MLTTLQLTTLQLTTLQITTLTTCQLTTLQFTTLTTLQITMLTTLQITMLTTLQITTLTTLQITMLTTLQITTLTTLQITMLTTLQITMLTTLQITMLTTLQITMLTTLQITTLTTLQITMLTTLQITMLTTVQITRLTTLQITMLTTLQITMLTTLQITMLTTLQITMLTTLQITMLTTLQITMLTTLQLCTLNPTPRSVHDRKFEWDKLLENVHCLIISVTKTDRQEAYILSESSMFVSKRRFILKTCGTTLLLQALVPLLELARQYCGFDAIKNFFYSRKNFMKPTQQEFPHRNFQEEVDFLALMFPNGASYCMGRLNSDCWYLFTLDLPEFWENKNADQTLEVLMSDLDPAIMDQFYMKDGVSANDVTRMSGIRDLIPGSVIDATMFNPCGYSMNGMKTDGTYWTIHITPEPEFSYVSFETNLSQTSYDDLVQKVVEISKCRSVFSSAQKMEGFKRQDRQLAQFNDYNFVFTSYVKNLNQQS
ncbi:hypothetical protein NHX12_026621 [Muraenolepis orangiensis]|uniref:adenosylmethionine decarboxylase n=1 Tax=Muraenolepis orangiensis TaxID=630683 RepID=A0A9Q0INF3_9TELE|nr:hypothetical protein NHX12_026621 [Muraenolepis orangiensis]